MTAKIGITKEALLDSLGIVAETTQLSNHCLPMTAVNPITAAITIPRTIPTSSPMACQIGGKCHLSQLEVTCFTYIVRTQRISQACRWISGCPASRVALPPMMKASMIPMVITATTGNMTHTITNIVNHQSFPICNLLDSQLIVRDGCFIDFP